MSLCVAQARQYGLSLLMGKFPMETKIAAVHLCIRENNLLYSLTQKKKRASKIRVGTIDRFSGRGQTIYKEGPA